jgi:hypothetical protein
MDNSISPNRFYVYILTNSLTGQVFYVGKGQRQRMHEHVWQAKRGIQSSKCDLIREILASGGEVIPSKDQENLTHSEALERESYLIKVYGEENLANGTFKGNTNARGKRKPQGKELVQVGISVSGSLRDQIESCMALDGIEYSREGCYEYVKKICYQALQDHIRQFS